MLLQKVPSALLRSATFIVARSSLSRSSYFTLKRIPFSSGNTKKFMTEKPLHSIEIPMTAVSLPLLEKRDETPLIKSYIFDASHLPKPFSFKPGQWADFYLTSTQNHIEGDKVLVAGFSMASSSYDTKRLRFAVKKTEHPVTQYFHDFLKVGEKVILDGGYGQFKHERNSADELVLIAGGIGITPLISILLDVLPHEERVKATFLYSVTEVSELLWHDELSALSKKYGAQNRFHYAPTVSRHSHQSWNGRRGRIDRHFLEQEGISDIVHRSSSSSPHRRVKYFLCGPPSLVHDVRAMLLSFGAKEADIMYERWQR